MENVGDELGWGCNSTSVWCSSLTYLLYAADFHCLSTRLTITKRLVYLGCHPALLHILWDIIKEDLHYKPWTTSRKEKNRPQKHCLSQDRSTPSALPCVSFSHLLHTSLSNFTPPSCLLHLVCLHHYAHGAAVAVKPHPLKPYLYLIPPVFAFGTSAGSFQESFSLILSNQ